MVASSQRDRLGWLVGLFVRDILRETAVEGVSGP